MHCNGSPENNPSDSLPGSDHHQNPDFFKNAVCNFFVHADLSQYPE